MLHQHKTTALAITVDVLLCKCIAATGSGSSKQLAEQNAARTALRDIEAEKPGD
ncbi:MAG TPA: putative dsRNA-binding protein [Anaerolineae bacterium]